MPFQDWLPLTIQLQSFHFRLDHIQILIDFFQKPSDYPALVTRHQQQQQHHQQQQLHQQQQQQHQPNGASPPPPPSIASAQSAASPTQLPQFYPYATSSEHVMHRPIPILQKADAALSTLLTTLTASPPPHTLPDTAHASSPRLAKSAASSSRSRDRFFLLFGYSAKFIETTHITKITICNWHCSRSRAIGNVVDSISERRKRQL